MRVLIWFHRDLRLHDHAGLHWARAHGKHIEAVVIPPANAGTFKLAHWQKVVRELEHNLDRLAIRLTVLTEDLAAFVARQKFDIVLTHQRMSFREQQLPALPCELKLVGDLTLYDTTHAQALTLRDLKPFTKFKNFAQAYWTVPAEHPELAAESSSALERLRHYLHTTKAVHHYHESRNGMLAVDDSSKLSPWLAWGALSPRRVFFELEKLLPSKGAEALIYELIWRDYFKFLAFVQGESFHARDGLRPAPFDWHDDPASFEAWRRGETGEDFVDANMRELLHTGWLSNRGRQNVASYLAKTLKLDWTLGAKWFERELIDEDPENNYGNWQYVAGVGTDPRDRIFDVRRQAQMYDADGEYRQKWLREDELFAAKIFELLADRAPGATICPSEVLPADEKKIPERMERVRAAARRLVNTGHIQITQKGIAMGPYSVRGPIRLRKGRLTSNECGSDHE